MSKKYDKRSVSKYGLKLSEIVDIKCWFVKEQDFENAVVYREMERSVIGKRELAKQIKNRKHKITLDTILPVYIKLNLMLSKNWTLNKTETNEGTV